ncbi:unnamed protein product [Amoebophrya sp. A25]|nr:unnamed protein product [Amoebophrya sp. A25]|eukprot:GSA25T00004071001.1
MVYNRAELSIRVPVAFMGGLIGYQGETIRKIQQDSGAAVKVFPRDPRVLDMRQVIISKDVEAGITAMFDVFERELKNASKGQLARLADDHQFSFKVDVASNQIGAVIGKRGAGAHSIRENSGCQMRIQGEGEVQLTGMLSQVKKAMHGVWESIEEIPSLYNIMRVSESFYKSPLAGPTVNVVLHLPDDTVGMLIGRRGATISSIRRECTGVRIDIDSSSIPLNKNEEKNSASKPSNNSTTYNNFSNNTNSANTSDSGTSLREVSLRGTLRATCRAHQMIAALVENDMRRKNRPTSGPSGSNLVGGSNLLVGGAGKTMGDATFGTGETFGTPDTALPGEHESSPDMIRGN